MKGLDISGWILLLFESAKLRASINCIPMSQTVGPGTVSPGRKGRSDDSAI